jgi:hypothetical protein
MNHEDQICQMQIVEIRLHAVPPSHTFLLRPRAAAVMVTGTGDRVFEHILTARKIWFKGCGGEDGMCMGAEP